MNLCFRSIGLLAAFGVSGTGAFAARIYVDRSAPLTPFDGTSWGHAYHDLQLALAAAVNGDEIWVANGSYKPATSATPNSRSLSFEMESNVRLYGGFHGATGHDGSGGETSLAQRDPLAFPTILSGDIGSDDTPSFGNRADNSIHVLHSASSVSSTGVDGFIVEGGNADGLNQDSTGGGALVEGSDVYFVNCWFRGCRASFKGGAVQVNDSAQSQLIGCILTGNSAPLGSAYSMSGGQSGLFDCTFTGNTCTTPAGSAVRAEFADFFLCTGSILWGNANGNGQGQEAQLQNIFVATVSLQSVDIQGGTHGLVGGGLISVNPGFVDADGPDDTFGTADDDVRLRPLSACIDRLPASVMQGDLTDSDGDGIFNEKTPLTIAGEARSHDDPGVAGGNFVDLGAQEFQGSSCLGNLNADSVVNTADLTLFLSKFGQSVPAYTQGDFNGDATVDTADLTLLLSRFGQSCASS